MLTFGDVGVLRYSPCGEYAAERMAYKYDFARLHTAGVFAAAKARGDFGNQFDLAGGLGFVAGYAGDCLLALAFAAVLLVRFATYICDCPVPSRS